MEEPLWLGPEKSYLISPGVIFIPLVIYTLRNLINNEILINNNLIIIIVNNNFHIKIKSYRSNFIIAI